MVKFISPTLILESETTASASSTAYNSSVDQAIDMYDDSSDLYFTLYDNDLSGTYVVSGEYSQVGWVSSAISDSDGNFAVPQTLTISFADRPIVEPTIVFDNYHNNIVVDFDVTFTKLNADTVTYQIRDNHKLRVSITDGVDINDVVSVIVTIYKTSIPYAPAVVMEMPVHSTVLYKGYEDASDLMSIDLLEELSYEDDIEALGGVSANEVTVVLDNADREFFFNSGSPVARQLRRNRKIAPYLGAEVIPGEIEWYKLGTFWSYKWDVPADGLTATVVGFDTIGLLSTTTYMTHQIQVDKSIGDLLEYVLGDAALMFDFLKYNISRELYDIKIPYAWFAYGSHADAIRKISLCYPMHIYCDRNGVINAAPHKLHVDYYYDRWSNNTNVISKSYSSLYTTLPNIINVRVNNPLLETDAELLRNEVAFDVQAGEQLILDFTKPYLKDIVVNVDSTVQYTYTAYSWGIVFTFSSAGTVNSIVCYGTAVDISNSTIVTKRDAESIRLNGSITRNVESDFIQTADLAKTIVDRLFSFSDTDKYDAEVEYRGDISLTINDPILLEDGIAPDNRYNIRRHNLYWAGYLTGSADLNT